MNRLRERLARGAREAHRPAARALHGRPPGLRHRRPARRRLPAAARDAEVRAPRRARRHAAARPRAPRAHGRRPRADALHRPGRAPRARGDGAVRARRDALASITAGLRDRRALAAPRPRRPARRARPRPRRPPQRRARAASRLLAARARAAARRRPRRPVGDPVADRAVRVRRPELPPNSAGASGYYQFMQRHLEGPRRLDAARLPGVQGRAGPARGAAVGRRRRARTTGSAPSLVDEVYDGRSRTGPLALLDEIPVAPPRPARRGRPPARAAGHVRARRRHDRQRDRRQAQARGRPRGSSGCGATRAPR